MQFAVSLDPFMMWSEPSLVKPKMPNPAPKSCEVQDCEYKIPMGLTSHEQQFQDIRLHLVMVHPLVFTNQADARYAPIEGKCLGAARAMKCQYFLLAVDHNHCSEYSMVRVWRKLRIQGFRDWKRRRSKFNFSLVHVPGKLHKTADGTSRQPVAEADNDVEVLLAGLVDSRLYRLYIYNLDRPIVSALHARALTLDRVKEASAADQSVTELIPLIEDGLPEIIFQFCQEIFCLNRSGSSARRY